MLSVQPVMPAELEPFVSGGSQLQWQHNKKTSKRETFPISFRDGLELQ